MMRTSKRRMSGYMMDWTIRMYRLTVLQPPEETAPSGQQLACHCASHLIQHAQALWTIHIIILSIKSCQLGRWQYSALQEDVTRIFHSIISNSSMLSALLKANKAQAKILNMFTPTTQNQPFRNTQMRGCNQAFFMLELFFQTNHNDYQVPICTIEQKFQKNKKKLRTSDRQMKPCRHTSMKLDYNLPQSARQSGKW